MPLKLYRRHRKECEAGYPEDERTGEFEEGRRGFKKCACLIHATGTLGGKFKRQQTGKAIWAEAKIIASAWEAADSWDQKPKPEPPTAPVPPPGRIMIAEAANIFLRNREGAAIASSTLGKYKTFTKQLQAFADSRGYLILDQFTPADIDALYHGWKLGPRAKGKLLGTVRSFFRFCVNRKWLPENPVSPDLRPPIGANTVVNKAPFSDEELKRILAACDKVGQVDWTSGRTGGSWSGDDVKDFIWVMIHTGLRISDVGLFHMDRVRGNEVFLRAKKNGGDVYAFLPNWLLHRLNTRAQKTGPRLFMPGQSDRLDTVTDMWRRKINKVFALAGRFDERPTPHRFRHTFARILLERGVSVADVADLLGDDERTVKEHYARWVPERQARLTKILKTAFKRGSISK